MSFRFWRRVKILPGVTLNLSKSGGSLSFGGRGARFTVGPKGRRTTVGIPGTGLFYTETSGRGKSGGRGRASVVAAPTVRPQDRLTIGFFKRLITPDDEEALVDGCRELALGNEDKAFEKVKEAIQLADGAFTAGFLALKKKKLDEAERFFSLALDNHKRLGRYFSKYGVSVTMSLPITGEILAHVTPGLRGVLLALTEVYQRQARRDEAVTCLKRLKRLEPDDVVVKLSLAELLMEEGDRKKFQEVIRLSENIEPKLCANGLIHKTKVPPAIVK